MKCLNETQETAELLVAFWARGLDAETAAGLERHIESCPACRSTFDAQRVVWGALDQWDAAQVTPDFDRRLYRRIDEEVRASWWKRVSRVLQPLLVQRGLPLAAAACLLVMAGALIDQPRLTTAPPVRSDLRVEAVLADQVEKTLEDMELLRTFSADPRAEAQQSNSM